MNLSVYNILAHLISGFLVYLVGLYALELEPNYLDPFMATAVAYLIGYFVNSISAWVEFILNWTWSGRPSDQLLVGKGCGRIQFPEWKKILKLLQKELDNKKTSADDLFKVAMRKAKNGGRIPEMNGQYAFSRSVLIAILISVVFLGIPLYQNIGFWIISLILILASWYRAKERGFYYAKEVLSEALNKFEKN
ncbi:MAG: hypothetical protein K9M51_01445 [Candidatus Gracilibacteria bacterium]|nr:hypothetical protein [Candidatus Gracilibacteria bacterium]